MVIFSVEATGIEPLSYQWRYNNVNIPGATATDYVLNNVQTNHMGEYSVLVVGPSGSALSDDASLTVLLSDPLRFELISILPDSRIHLSFAGESDGTYIIEGSTNLIEWLEVTNLVITNGVFEFIEEPDTNRPQRYYRLRTGIPGE